jgi:hypothetical protein
VELPEWANIKGTGKKLANPILSSISGEWAWVHGYCSTVLLLVGDLGAAAGLFFCLIGICIPLLNDVG